MPECTFSQFDFLIVYSDSDLPLFRILFLFFFPAATERSGSKKEDIEITQKFLFRSKHILLHKIQKFEEPWLKFTKVWLFSCYWLNSSHSESKGIQKMKNFKVACRVHILWTDFLININISRHYCLHVKNFLNHKTCIFVMNSYSASFSFTEFMKQTTT